MRGHWLQCSVHSGLGSQAEQTGVLLQLACWCTVTVLRELQLPVGFHCRLLLSGRRPQLRLAG